MGFVPRARRCCISGPGLERLVAMEDRRYAETDDGPSDLTLQERAGGRRVEWPFVYTSHGESGRTDIFVPVFA